jgi:hypothetical protein
MNRIVLLAAALLSTLVVSCDRDTAAVSQEEAEQAFLIGYSALVVGSMRAAFRQTPAGVEINEERQMLTYTDFDVSDLGTPYDTLSGKVTGTESGSEAEFELEGGPARTISFSVGSGEMFNGDRLQLSIEVNGRSYEIDMDRAVLE